MLTLSALGPTKPAWVLPAIRNSPPGPRSYDLLAGCVEAVNRDLAADRDLAGQVIGRFLILPKPLDADDGELTRMGKIRRAVIAERYAALIEGLYSGRDRARISMRISFDDGRRACWM